MIVLDTNVLSELLRVAPDPAVAAWMDGWDSADLTTTAITAAELRAGAAVLPRGRRSTAMANSVDRLLEEAFAGRVLTFDTDSAAHYAEVLSTRRRAGAPISVLDAQIAAISRQYGATLATRNTRDFEGVGLELINPWVA